MTRLDPHETLAEIVDAHPRVAATFDHLGLDYCCGGATTLAEACQSAGIDPDLLCAEVGEADSVEPADSPDDWTTYGPTRLIDHIVARHHRYLRTELPRVETLLDRVLGVHGARHPELGAVRETFLQLRSDLETHIDHEEITVFPLIKRVATANPHGVEVSRSPGLTVTMILSATLKATEQEHEQVGAALAALRTLTAGYRVPDDACASYTALLGALADLEADTHLHVHKENNHLFVEARWLATQTGELL